MILVRLLDNVLLVIFLDLKKEMDILEHPLNSFEKKN